MTRELIGEGRTAEVFALDDDRVVKVIRPGFDPAALRREADKTVAAGRSGAPAPPVLGELEIGGRPGVIFGRAGGDSMLEVLVGNPARIDGCARRAALIHAAVLRCTTADLPDIKDSLAARIDAADGLSRPERTAVKNTLRRLPDGESLLHGDFHPGNIHLTERAHTVIDWVDAASGPAAADVARSLLLLTPRGDPGQSVPAALIELADRFRALYMNAVLPAVGLSGGDVDVWRLPVTAGRLSEEIAHETESLVLAVRQLLR